jgi:hypothetical protein
MGRKVTVTIDASEAATLIGAASSSWSVYQDDLRQFEVIHALFGCEHPKTQEQESHLDFSKRAAQLTAKDLFDLLTLVETDVDPLDLERHLLTVADRVEPDTGE